MGLMLIILCSLLIFVLKIERKMPWIVVAGAIGYPISYYSMSYFAYDILRFSGPQLGMAITPENFIVYQLNSAIVEASVGALFGLILGLILGYQRNNNQPQLTAGI